MDKIQNDLQKELNVKTKTVQLQDEKLKIATGLVNKSNQGLEALTLVIKYYLAQVEQLSGALHKSTNNNKHISTVNAKLSTENDDFKATVADVKEKLETESCRCESLQKEFEALGVNHESELSRIRDEHNAEKNQLAAKHKQEHEQQLNKTLDEHRIRIQENNLTHEDEIQFLKEHHEKAINKLKNQHERLLEEKEKEHLEVVSRVKDGSSPRVTSPGGTFPISADNYANLPEELKSLHIVLDMKNEELKNLRTKKMELERKVDDFYELQNKYDALYQKSQSLSEVLKQKQDAERQLSVERENLKEKFEKESRKVSRLSMEKEQLMWRASNPDLSYNHLNNFDEEDDEEVWDSPPSPLRPSSGSLSANSTPRGVKVNGEAEIAKKLKRRSMNF